MHLFGLSNVDKNSVDGQMPVRLCNYMDVYKNERINGAMNFMAATATPEQVRRFSLRTGDVLITKDSESWSDIAVPAVIAEDFPEVLCGYHLALVRPSPDYSDGAFLARAFSAPGPRDQFHIAANGITRFGLGGDTIRAGLFPTPPLEEQRAIAAFLDKETASIDGLVAKKERLIELLQEKRAALVTRAVTKGLDPSVPMKDSGVEWMGQIPASWSLVRLKHLVVRVEQGWSPLCENRQADEDEWGVLKVGCVNGMEFDATENKALPSDLDPLEDLEIAPGDILMSRANTRLLLGSAALVQSVRPRLLLCDKLYRIRVRPELVLPRFLVHAFSSLLSRFQFEREATGASASMQNISQQMILELLVPCSPLEEQHRIVEVVARNTARLSGLIEKVGHAVARLKELRTALISAAVTGKIDVRDENA